MQRPTQSSVVRPLKWLAIGGLVAGCLAGCSGADSGIEMNGKLFDVAGLTGIGKKGSEPKLAERAPLVPPPRTGALPQPGEAQAAGGHMAWPDDPDKRRVAKGSTDTKALKKFCDDPMLGRPEAERAKRDAECADKQGGLLSKASSLLPGFGNKKEGAAAETSDEGDPGVVTGSTKAQAASAQKPIGSAKTR